MLAKVALSRIREIASIWTGGYLSIMDSRTDSSIIPGEEIAALCRLYGVRKLSVFGSAARGEMTPESDVDLMVEFEPASKVTLWDMSEVQAGFSAIFGGRRVDLVPPEVMRNPFRRKTILADLRVLYET